MSFAFFGWVRIRPARILKPLASALTPRLNLDSHRYWAHRLDRLSEFLARFS